MRARDLRRNFIIVHGGGTPHYNSLYGSRIFHGETQMPCELYYVRQQVTKTNKPINCVCVRKDPNRHILENLRRNLIIVNGGGNPNYNIIKALRYSKERPQNRVMSASRLLKQTNRCILYMCGVVDYVCVPERLGFPSGTAIPLNNLLLQ